MLSQKVKPLQLLVIQKKIFELDCLLHLLINLSKHVKIFLQATKLDDLDEVVKKVLPCNLDKPTQSLIKLIFDNDMFKEAMQNMEIGRLKYC